MTLHQIIEESKKEWNNTWLTDDFYSLHVENKVKSFIFTDYTNKLLEGLREEINRIRTETKELTEGETPIFDLAVEFLSKKNVYIRGSEEALSQVDTLISDIIKKNI